MKKKLTKHGNSLAIVIDKPILEMLKINEKSNIEMLIEGGELIIRKQKKSTSKKDLSPSNESIDRIAKKILTKYGPLFDKLSKE
jgi:antitoxin component of MazEF toxin-antitoxin module